jgi:hypothetical protein
VAKLVAPGRRIEETAMTFDFKAVFKEALGAGVAAARPGGQAAENWLRDSAKANESALKAIAEGIAARQISRETGAMLLRETARALESEAAALAVGGNGTARTAVNAFLDSLTRALASTLKLAI